MNNKILVGASVFVTSLLVLGSFYQVVGVQSMNAADIKSSPLFTYRTQKATNHAEAGVISNFLGKGEDTDIRLLFPAITLDSGPVREVVERIHAMNDAQFQVLIKYALSYWNQGKGKMASSQVFSRLHQIRDEPKAFLDFMKTQVWSVLWIILLFFLLLVLEMIKNFGNTWYIPSNWGCAHCINK